MTDVSTDHGSVLPPGSSALVVSAEGELSFYLPDNPPDAPVPRLVQLLAAVLMRSEDEDWVEEMLGIFEDQSRN
ncbi:hypothetical protein JQ506_05915 [Shinella sp. PSBB067]|uniref:hypothetical protein n=1 Tax=Shinella sp. PSBB067 TaxID=2715959 RepID=UPI00193B71E0|nr:hypothetical protein [Shinella sp. PSBB067]QRI64533.1 hypothetical protein JQ506_05915 [Shinella sp. PSBB067]